MGSAERREDILRAAGRLFARKGVAATTVREIADEVGMLSGSLYHHFDSKAAMVEAIIVSHLDDLRSRFARVVSTVSDPRECVAALIRESFRTIDDHPFSAEIYQNDQEFVRQLPLREAAAEIQRTWLSVLGAGVARGVFRDDVPPAMLYRLIRDAVWPSVRWFTPTAEYPRERLAADCAAVFLDGIGARHQAGPSAAAASTPSAVAASAPEPAGTRPTRSINA
jgi:TetR/AcrR family transcriptional regulator, cholesterol catabolism regulator